MGWVFGLSVFSLKGEHIGWFGDGVFYDVQNKVLGFLPGATGLALEMPALAPEPATPVFSKRPYAPTLRGRTARPRGEGWSAHCLASYFAFGDVPTARTRFLARRAGAAKGSTGDLAH